MYADYFSQKLDSIGELVKTDLNYALYSLFIGHHYNYLKPHYYLRSCI